MNRLRHKANKYPSRRGREEEKYNPKTVPLEQLVQTVDLVAFKYFLKEIVEYLRYGKKDLLFPTLEADLEALLVRIICDKQNLLDLIKVEAIDDESKGVIQDMYDILKDNTVQIAHTFENMLEDHTLVYKKVYLPKTSQISSNDPSKPGTLQSNPNNNVTSTHNAIRDKFETWSKQLYAFITSNEQTEIDFEEMLIDQAEMLAEWFRKPRPLGAGLKAAVEALRASKNTYEYKTSLLYVTPDQVRLIVEKVPINNNKIDYSGRSARVPPRQQPKPANQDEDDNAMVLFKLAALQTILNFLVEDKDASLVFNNATEKQGTFIMRACNVKRHNLIQRELDNDGLAIIKRIRGVLTSGLKFVLHTELGKLDRQSRLRKVTVLKRPNFDTINASAKSADSKNNVSIGSDSTGSTNNSDYVIPSTSGKKADQRKKVMGKVTKQKVKKDAKTLKGLVNTVQYATESHNTEPEDIAGIVYHHRFNAVRVSNVNPCDVGTSTSTDVVSNNVHQRFASTSTNTEGTNEVPKEKAPVTVNGKGIDKINKIGTAQAIAAAQALGHIKPVKPKVPEVTVATQTDDATIYENTSAIDNYEIAEVVIVYDNSIPKEASGTTVTTVIDKKTQNNLKNIPIPSPNVYEKAMDQARIIGQRQIPKDMASKEVLKIMGDANLNLDPATKAALGNIKEISVVRVFEEPKEGFQVRTEFSDGRPLPPRKVKLIEAMSTPVESDKAVRMMRQMGWEGGPLGARGEGITEPIIPDLHIAPGAGLGHVEPKAAINFRAELLHQIAQFVREEPLQKTFVFEMQMTRKDRAFVGAAIKAFADRRRLPTADPRLAALEACVREALAREPRLQVSAALTEERNTAAFVGAAIKAFADRRRLPTADPRLAALEACVREALAREPRLQVSAALTEERNTATITLSKNDVQRPRPASPKSGPPPHAILTIVSTHMRGLHISADTSTRTGRALGAVGKAARGLGQRALMLAKLLDAVRGHKYELTVTFEHPLTLKQVYFVQEVVNGVNLRSKMSYGIYENHLLDEVLKYSVDWILSVDFGSTHRESSKCGLYTWLMYKKKHRSKRVSNSNELANNNNKTDMISNNKEDGDDKVADETTNGFDAEEQEVANGVDDDEYEEVASSVDDVEDQDVAISFHDAEEQVGANDVDYEEQEVANSFHDAEEQIGYNGVDDKEERDLDNGVDDEEEETVSNGVDGKEQIVTNGVDDEEKQEVDNGIYDKEEQQVANNVNDAERQGVAIGYDYADDQEVANSVDNEEKQEVANNVDDEVEKHVANNVDDKEQEVANNVDDAVEQEMVDSVDDKKEQVEVDDGKLDGEFDDEVSDTYNAVTDLRFDSDDSDGATKCDDANSIEVSDVTDSVIKSSPEIKKEVSIQAVIKDEKNKIALPKFVCLAPESYPMDEVNFHIIQTMQNLICDKIEKNDEKPHIECVGVKNGAIIYGCHNEDGVRLIQTVAKEVGLELTNITKLYKDKKRYTVNARLNSWLDINLNKLYEFLEEYNTGLKTENWVMTDIKKNVGNIEMIIQIDENSFEFLSQNGFRLFAGVDMVRFGVIWN